MSLCIGFGCSTRPRDGLATCAGHAGLEPTSPPCPDGHGALAFIVVSGVELGGVLHLMYACPSCDYVTSTDYPPTASPERPQGTCYSDDPRQWCRWNPRCRTCVGPLSSQ